MADWVKQITDDLSNIPKALQDLPGKLPELFVMGVGTWAVHKLTDMVDMAAGYAAGSGYGSLEPAEQFYRAVEEGIIFGVKLNVAHSLKLV